MKGDAGYSVGELTIRGVVGLTGRGHFDAFPLQIF
jgi:hypothetical protein